MSNAENASQTPLPLRTRLEQFGDARNSGQWASGDLDYVAELGLTSADIPTLLTIAHQWIEPFDWPEDEKDVSGYAPVHAWRCLAQLRAPEAISLLLEMLDPMDEAGDDWHLEEFPDAFAWIGEASLAPLCSYLADDAHELYSRICVAGGLKELARRHTQLRQEAVTALCEALAHFQENDETFNGFLITELLDLKAVEAAELIERAHAADCVDLFVNGNWNDVREELGVPGLGLVPEELASSRDYGPLAFLSEEKRKQLAEMMLGSEGEPGDEDAPQGEYISESGELAAAPLKASPKIGRNEPCPCGSGKKYKKCCGA